jgi:hypothetical protein
MNDERHMKEEVSLGRHFFSWHRHSGWCRGTQNNRDKVTWMLYIHIQLSELGVGRRV